MIEVIWEFDVRPESVSEFEKHYSSQGTWAKLFSQDENFEGTALLRDTKLPLRYLTIDRWQTLEAYEAFKVKHASEYARIDKEMERLTSKERLVGVFTVECA
jgi:hypothetical protein